jgi:hypothetical protein
MYFSFHIMARAWMIIAPPQKCGPIGPQGYDRRITCIDGIETPILAFKLSGRIGRLRSFRAQIIYSGNIDYCSFREGTVLTGRISVFV